MPENSESGRSIDRSDEHQSPKEPAPARPYRLRAGTVLRELAFLLALDVLSLVGVRYPSWLFVKDARHANQLLRFLCPLSVMLAVLSLDHYGPHYHYDLPSVFLFTLTLAVRRSSRGWAFHVLVFVATLSKETSLLILIPHLLLLPKPVSRAGVLQGASFVGTWTAARFVSTGTGLFSNDNVATRFIPHNLEAVWQPGRSTFADPGGVLLLGLAAVSCFGFWERKPPILRSSMSLVAPFLGLFLIGGYWTESRALLELGPPVVIASLHTWWNVARPTRGGAEAGRSLFVTVVSGYVLVVAAYSASMVRSVEARVAEYARPGLVPRLPLAAVREVPAEGSAWDGSESTRPYSRGVVVDLEGETAVAGFTISADGNDGYLVRGLRGDTLVFSRLVPMAEDEVGMRVRRVSLHGPERRVVTMLHVIPWSGDGFYGFGGLTLEEDVEPVVR